MSIRGLLTYSLLLTSNILLGHYKLFDVEDMISKEKIEQIISEKDFFSRNEYKKGNPPLDVKKLEYGNFFFKNRSQVIDYDQSIDDAAGRSFQLASSLQDLYQANMDRHIAMGLVIPSLQLTMGDGIPISPKALFTGIFGFMLPQQWLRLRNNNLLYKISKAILLKTALDTTLNMRLTFLDAHRLARDMEILSFYFIHLELLNKYRVSKGSTSDSLAILRMAVYIMAVRLATIVNNLSLKFNDLAKAMNMITGDDGMYHSELLHVRMLDNLMDDVVCLDTLGPFYRDQETFLRTTIDRSIEMVIVENLVKVAGLNIGNKLLGML